jgi:hypothetical protein
MALPLSLAVLRKLLTKFIFQALIQWYPNTMYQIFVEPDKNLIHAELEGFWSEADFVRFLADEQTAREKLRCPAGKHILS